MIKDRVVIGLILLSAVVVGAVTAYALAPVDGQIVLGAVALATAVPLVLIFSTVLRGLVVAPEPWVMKAAGTFCLAGAVGALFVRSRLLNPYDICMAGSGWCYDAMNAGVIALMIAGTGLALYSLFRFKGSGKVKINRLSLYVVLGAGLALAGASVGIAIWKEPPRPPPTATESPAARG